MIAPVALATAIIMGFPAWNEGDPGRALLLGLLSVPVVVAGAVAPSNVLIGATLTTVVLAVITGDTGAATIAIPTYLMSVYVRIRNLPWVWMRSVITGTILWNSSHLELGDRAPLGTETVLAALIVGAVAVTGWQRHRRRIRTGLHVGVGLIVGVVIAGGLGAGIAGVSIRGPLTEARSALATARSAATEVRTAPAARALGAAADQLAQARTALRTPWARLGRLTPVVSDHLRYADALVDVTATELRASAEALDLMDLSRVALRNGRIDTAAVRDLTPPIIRIDRALTRVADTMDTLDTTWILPQVSTEIGLLRTDLDTLRDQVATAGQALELAPALLGAEAPMRYFVALTTPAESRGLGGFMGAFIELLIDDGRIEVTDRGSTGSLEAGPLPHRERFLTPDSRILDNYGRYGFNSGPGGSIQRAAWSNITMPPDLGIVGETIAQMYPLSARPAIDGVMLMDPYVMAALVDSAGGITLPDVDVRLRGDTTVEFLTRTMYERRENDGLERDLLLALVVEQAVGRVLQRGLDDPVPLMRTLGDLAGQRRFGLWLAEPSPLLGELGLDTSLPRPEGREGFMMITQNAAPNKADVHLRRAHSHDITLDPITGAVRGTTRITLTNTIDPDGQAEVVLNSQFGDPPGSIRLLITFLTRMNITDATIDGAPLPLARHVENGWQAWRTAVVLPPRSGPVDIELLMSGTRVPGPLEFVAIPLPLTVPEEISVRVVDTAGAVLASSSGPLTATTVTSTATSTGVTATGDAR